jgi:long-subunit acyl-CoA synthetase (AMP-forming)
VRQPVEFRNVDTLAEDVALIAFTSGTTGKPKGTIHFHRDVIAMFDCFPRSCLKPERDDLFIGTPPLAFTFGLGGLLCFPMRFGACTVLMEKLTPETLLEAIQNFKATILFTAPTMYRAIAGLAKNYDLRSLKKCVSAGEALPDATRQLFKQATGIEIIDGIGATEMIHIFISHDPAHVRRGATGHAIPGYTAAVLDENGDRCPPGRIGRLAVKGPTGCRYLADERQKNYVQNGWNFTGDAYVMDMDGYFIYQARTDDMIISSGYNISGVEVENALLAHAAVAECAVVGVPDEARGHLVKAFVVCAPGVEAFFPRAKLLVPRAEWESMRGLLPLQRRWYCPDAAEGIDPARVVLFDGDVSLGDGMAIVRTPGHTVGNASFVVHTPEGLLVTSENGVGPDSYAPRASAIPGVARYARRTGAEVILNGNTQEGSVDQYLSMVQEKCIAGPSAASASTGRRSPAPYSPGAGTCCCGT